MLRYLTGRPIDIPPQTHVVVTVVRNEMLRLPYFLTYYRKLGFDHFIFIDNASNDGTREFLVEQPDTFLFTTDASYGSSGYGMHWINHVLDEHCDDRWILCADADEMLVWPGCENQTIGQLTVYLDESHARGLFTLLLDMYSDKPFGEIGYVAGEPFIARCPFFDSGPYHLVHANMFPYHQIYGGVRARLFKPMNKTQFLDPTMSKLPLIRWQRGQRFRLSTHSLAIPLTLGKMRGALLHFKMFDDLPAKCEIEVARAQHYAGGREYWALAEAIKQSANRSFFDANVSVRYSDASQLVSMCIMSETGSFETRVAAT
jgi:Glycosyl transferase family 2